MANFWQTFAELTDIRTNYLEYQGVVQCLKRMFRDKTVETTDFIPGPYIPIYIHLLLKQKKGSQNIYNVLNKNKELPTGKIKWNRIYDLDDESWESIYQAPFQITKCSKLRWFQTSINHNILTTNKFLKTINLIDSPDCTLCGQFEETITHLFWHCSKTRIFLKELETKFQTNNIQLDLREKTFILGLYQTDTSKVLQFLLLIAKYYIYLCRCKNKPLNFKLYKLNVQSLYKTHKEMAVINNDLEKFLLAWSLFEQILL